MGDKCNVIDQSCTVPISTRIGGFANGIQNKSLIQHFCTVNHRQIPQCLRLYLLISHQRPDTLWASQWFYLQDGFIMWIMWQWVSTAYLDSFWWKPNHLQPLLCVRIAIKYMSIYQIYNTSFVHQLFAKHLHQFCLQSTNGYEDATILHWFCQQDKGHFNAVHRAGLYDKFKFMYPNLPQHHAMTSDRHVGLHSFPIFLMTNKQT